MTSFTLLLAHSRLKEIVKNLWENYANYQMNDFFTNKLSIDVVLEEGLRNSTIFK